MAKRTVSPAAQRSRSSSGETSTVLIVFLVFSILLNLGLGVATYFGFQHDNALKTENETLKKDIKVREDWRDWYRFQALSYRAYMGLLKGDEQARLADLRGQFDNKKLGSL